MDWSNHWLLWQLADSAFPIGGFAHSGGLEAAWQQGEVRSRDALASFLSASLSQTASGALPFVRETHTTPGRFAEVDLTCDAFLTNHVANRASRAQGHALFAVMTRSLSCTSLAGLLDPLRPANLPFHLAPVFGAAFRFLGIELEGTTRLFIFQGLRGLISSAVRLGIIGPLDGQMLHHKLAPEAERLCRCAGSVSLDDVAQIAPIQDLFQSTHDRLYSRLFQS